MKKICCTFLLALCALTGLTQDHQRVIVETTDFTRQFLTNDSLIEAQAELLLGTNLAMFDTNFFNNGMNGTNIFVRPDFTLQVNNGATITNSGSGQSWNFKTTPDPNTVPRTTNASFTGITTNIMVAVHPTAVYVPAGTLSGTLNGHTFTITGGTTAGMHIGDQFVTGSDSLNERDQYNITSVPDSTHLRVFEAITTTYSGAPWTFYPNAVYITDINVNPAGFIGSDGSLGMIGEYDIQGDNSAKLMWADGQYSWVARVQSQVDGYGLEFRSSKMGGAAQFRIHESADYYSLFIQADGNITSRFGLTNMFGSLYLRGPVEMPEGVHMGRALSLSSTNTSTPAATISGTAGTSTLTANTGIFTNIKPGWRVQIGGEGLTIGEVVNSTTVHVLETLQSTYAGATFQFYPAVITSQNVNSSPAFFVAGDGSVGIAGANQLQSNSGRLMFANGLRSWIIRPTLQAVGWRLEFQNQNAGGGGAVTFHDSAPFDSLDVMSDGTISARIGFTNAFGPTLLAGQLAGNATGLTNTVVTVTANYTALATDSTILVNAATKTITLPTAVGIPGKTYTIKLIAAATTATVSGAQNIDGSASYTLSAQYKSVTVRSDGTQWWIIGAF